MKRALITVILGVTLGIFVAVMFLAADRMNQLSKNTLTPVWPVRSIDTMKYSRDVAAQMLTDVSFDQTIDRQVHAIARTGASHIAIATPYDEQFVPFLARWVKTARSYGLHIWFRGNFSGWEQWFNYPKITREQHAKLLTSFLTKHGDLFVDGDIFTPCPECENGGPGDPRQTGDLAGHRQFLIREYRDAKTIFQTQGKHVAVGYDSMNYDVATEVMDPETTRALGGIVVIDHYVETPDKLDHDITKLAASSGGKIVLGEMGYPIPDINGNASDTDQATWLRTAFTLLSQNQNVMGINYWVNEGGSTSLWNGEGVAKPAVSVMTDFFHSQRLSGIVYSSDLKPIADARVQTNNEKTVSDASGRFNIFIHPEDTTLRVVVGGYADTAIHINNTMKIQNIIMAENTISPMYKIIDYIDRLYLNIF